MFLSSAWRRRVRIDFLGYHLHTIVYNALIKQGGILFVSEALFTSKEDRDNSCFIKVDIYLDIYCCVHELP